MQFSTMYQEVAAQCGMDYTDSQQLTLIKRWINTSLKFIYAQAPWPFLRSSNPLVIQTVTDYTTGTVTTVAGAVTGTFSATPSATLGSFLNYYVQTSSSNDWYRIASHTAGSTSFTIDSPGWISALTAGTFIVRKFYYSTSSAVDRILQINQSATPYHLEERTKETFDSILPNQFSTGVPRIYMMAGLDASGYWQFKLWPSPSSVINLYIDYLLVGTDLSSDSDVSIIPEKWHRAGVIEGGCFQGYRFLNDSRAGESQTLEQFMQPVIQKMLDEYLPSTNLQRVLRSVDDYPMRSEFPLPVNYPNV
jgi:hypothetical protein